MSDDKKRIGVVVSSESANAKGDAPAFNFTEFQNQFYAEGDGQNPEAYHTAYQCRKTSCVSGVSADELLTQHRKSIIDLCKQGSPNGDSTKLEEAGVDVKDLMGVTLSRRHTQSNDEYNEELAVILPLVRFQLVMFLASLESLYSVSHRGRIITLRRWRGPNVFWPSWLMFPREV